ncbi:GAF domain-containing protein, partial [bacterium]|nr:GAF domain-containing protein [bacterium]
MKILIQKDQQLWIFLLLFMMIGIGFFVPISMNYWMGVLVKGSLFVVVFLIGYVFFSTLDRTPFLSRQSHHMDSTSQEKILSKELPEDKNWTGFGKALSTFVGEFLSIIRSMMVGSSFGFYLYQNRERLEFHIGENEYQRFTQRLIIKKESLVEQIARQKTAVIENNLPIGTVLDGISDSEIRSLIGCPLIWENGTIGVIVIGSKTTGSFSNDDRDFLVRCGQLITHMMAICHKGLCLETDQEVYQVHLDLEREFKHIEEEDQAIAEFVKQIKKLFPFDRFTFCLKEGDEGIIDYVYGQVDDMDQGMRFPLEEGLNGWMMKRNTPLLLADMQEGNLLRPRYLHNEDARHGLRSFLGIALGNGE